jgi:hypothetical protein
MSKLQTIFHTILIIAVIGVNIAFHKKAQHKYEFCKVNACEVGDE